MANSTLNQPSAQIISFADYASVSSSVTHIPAENAYGEQPLKGAPCVLVADGVAAVPQQFLQVTRSLENIEAILAGIDFNPNYPLFAGVEGQFFYVQVGVIGSENYLGGESGSYGGQLGSKIVYGRKWLIESSTPTSEVVQTVLLALKKAREHELREHLCFYSKNGVQRATPFNTHIDLPLLAHVAATSGSTLRNSADATSFADLAQFLERVRFSGAVFELDSLLPIDPTTSIATLRLKAVNPLFPEFEQANVRVMFAAGNTGHFLHALMEALIQCSDHYVQENFTFKGFARFSRGVCPTQLAKFSIDTRKVGPLSRDCSAAFIKMNTLIDARRAPRLNQHALGLKQLTQIKQFSSLEGYLPD